MRWPLSHSSLKPAPRGSVLVALLWCLALLSVVVIGVLHAGRMDLMVAKNYGDRLQAHYLAVAGIERAKAMLYQDAANRRRSKVNHNGQLFDSPRDFRDVPLGRGHFRVFRQGRRDEAGGGVVYGVGDEESRLNLNTASAEELAKLPGMSQEIAAAIVSWRSSGNQAMAMAPDGEYYASLQPPRRPRQAPFQTVRELLMVRGVNARLFFGEDTNQNGLLDQEEDDGNETPPADNHDGLLDSGLSGLVTVDSQVEGTSASGDSRIDVQSASETELSAVSGITADIAKAIVAYRGQKKFESLADLLDVTPPQPQRPGAQPPNNQPAPDGGGGNPPPDAGASPPVIQTQNNNAGSNEKLISTDLLMSIADELSAGGSKEQAGVVNLNTAGSEVLACLPGMTAELAQAVVNYRQSSGYFPNIAYLLKVSGMTREIFKQVCPKVAVRSETYRILCEGKVTSSGARERIQIIVRVSSTDVVTLSYREDL